MNAVIALNPAQMQAASSTMLEWAGRKLALAEHELVEADELHAQLVRAGVGADAAKSMMNRAAKRVTFYEKVKAAIAAGYYIIPPFNNLQVFAVRTARKNPNVNRRDDSWGRHTHQPEGLSIDAGHWINPEPIRDVIDHEKRGEGDKARSVAIYGSTAFRDEIELPVMAMKPQVIDAVGHALEQKIFDALAIAPAREQNADPIIAGILRRPGGRQSLTFLVAWWLDEADL